MKKYLKYFAVAVVVAVAYGFYYVNKPKASLAKKQPDVVISPRQLLEDFVLNEEQANTKYLDKIVKVSGKVASKTIDANQKVTILMDTGDPMSNVTCELSAEQTGKSSLFGAGSFIEVKGICTGMLSDVVLVDCVILDN